MEIVEEPKGVALITGITGQDGSYLAEEFIQREGNWQVYGLMRRSSVFTTERIDHIFSHPQLHLRHGDMTDIAGMMSVLAEIRTKHFPDVNEDSKNEGQFLVFNMAAQSHVGVSFETPLYTAQVDSIGVLHLLEAIRSSGLAPIARICQASTSELYGKVQETPQTETTPFYPRSPYGVAKLYGYWIVKNYREAYGLWACNSICMNHESPRRGKTFVTRKITCAVAKMQEALDYPDGRSVMPAIPPRLKVLRLGNLEAKRDWGHAQDYIRGMIRMLEVSPQPDDYVLATGETHSVREFVECAFKHIGRDIRWSGEGVDEFGEVQNAKGEWVTVVRVDPAYFRPAEVDLLLGDATKAREVLGWEPTIKFEQLVKQMMEADLNELSYQYQ